MPYLDPQLTLTAGLLLAAALVVALAAEAIRLPKVTAYLLVGMLLGPGVLDLLPHRHIEELEPLTKLAMALVLFQLGSGFSLTHIRRILPRALPLSYGELGLTFVLVSAGLPLVGEGWAAAIILGALALATAPATTLLVLQETESEGVITNCAGPMVALNNFVSIVLFEVLFLSIGAVEGGLAEPVPVELWYLTVDIVGSILLGAAAGVAVSYLTALLAGGRWTVLLVGAILLVLGICQTLGIPYMLCFLAMGILVANTSAEAGTIVERLERLTGFLCVFFFVVHGAELDLPAFLHVGWIGAAYIVLRSGGKYFGVRAVASARGEEPVVQQWLGTTLLAQAGAAIALSAIAVSRAPELGRHVQSIILGSVVFFELLGPVLIRMSVVRGGEVPLANVIRHTRTTPLEELRGIANRLLAAVGRDPLQKQPPEQLTVGQLLRRNVRGLPETATFDETLRYIEHSHDDTFFLVDEANRLRGVIRYHEVSTALFDPRLGALVRANDLATPAEHVLHPDDPVSKARAMFHSSRDDCIPVVTSEAQGRYEGVVRRWDVLRLYFRERGGGGETH